MQSRNDLICVAKYYTMWTDEEKLKKYYEISKKVLSGKKLNNREYNCLVTNKYARKIIQITKEYFPLNPGDIVSFKKEGLAIVLGRVCRFPDYPTWTDDKKLMRYRIFWNGKTFITYLKYLKKR